MARAVRMNPTQERRALTMWVEFNATLGNPPAEDAEAAATQMRATALGPWGWYLYGEWVRAVSTLLSAERVRELPWPVRLRIVRFAREWRELWPLPPATLTVRRHGG